jgi:fructan beta-fructosidase
MRKLFNIICVALLCADITASAQGQNKDETYHEKYRPQIHFSPKAHWTNDPNGMVYYNGIYHLFFQYYPNGTTWGPMHWGHAESKDLMHWKEMPIALYPDSLGYIFSGSAVADVNNTSGFGKNGKVPLVAIFTHHDPKGEREGKNNFQNESLAYSLDNGSTWTKYSGNPVLKNPGIRDFRDPKVMWYAAAHKWVMTLATQDHITFFSSPDLKHWKEESQFGKQAGAHGGVWECPDLISLPLNGKVYWILIVNLNPGGPNGGSATQYFVGDFDGHEFKPMDSKTRWVDYGPDEYAGVTWNNTGSRKIFLGWMSNWQYANQVPTEKWRNAMTIPRELSLARISGDIYLKSQPAKELTGLVNKEAGTIKTSSNGDILTIAHLPKQYILNFNPQNQDDYTITLANEGNEKLVIGFDKAENRYYIDRSKSGKTDFNNEFTKMAYAPRLSANAPTSLKLVVDASSIELFADDDLVVMTSVFFPNQLFDHLEVKAASISSKNIVLLPLKSIW